MGILRNTIFTSIITGLLYLFAHDSYAQESEVRINRELNTNKNTSSYTSIASFKSDYFKAGLQNLRVFDDEMIPTSHTQTGGFKATIPVGDKTKLECTVFGENAKSFAGKTKENNRLKLRLDSKSDPFNFGAMYGENEQYELEGAYGKFKSNGDASFANKVKI
jgi:hypothetical protein